MSLDRYAADIPFPAYAFVPGKHPHPVTDSLGHSFGEPHFVPQALDSEHPATSREFLFAIDLFNAGFYWEAHEAWEGLWIAAGRAGTQADFLKGLIKLAAAGVKAREGQSTGVQRHAKRAAELFQHVSAARANDQKTYAGLTIEELIRMANSISAEPRVDDTQSIGGRPVLSFRLVLAEG